MFILPYCGGIRQENLKSCLDFDIQGIVGPSGGNFDKTLRTAFHFRANYRILWNSGRLENRRAVLKLICADRLSYKWNEGFRTVDLSFPFKALT
ncbi:hypothetical protein Bra5_CH00468 [Rhizobium phaseoli Brasil 5]|nr:hypothetical protein Bra5_CH00468 [Rhizobium phaseoli Brasil 5]